MPEQQMRVLADRYELIAPLGRGTMGTVWRAHDRSLGREVAIKEIRQEPGLSEAQRTELRERMIREGRMAARISHPSVATVHDAIVEDGRPWIIMELVQARSLERVIEEEGPLPPRLVAEIGVDLLGALRAAHAQGVLHRDVKPGNVLITESGRVVLTDFGIAKAEGDTSLTRTGMVIGSPGYTAPERARGEHNGPESDLWALGATLYFAVEGRPAYERSSVAETLAALMSEQVDPPTQAGPLRPVLEQLLEKDHTLRLTAVQASTMLRSVADTPSHLADSVPVTPVAPGAPRAPVTPVEPVAPQAPEKTSPAGNEFDADRTMMVIRPKGGLRIPGNEPAAGAAPSAPSSPAFPRTAPPNAPPAGGRPGGPPVPGLGAPVARRQGSPDLPPGTPAARPQGSPGPPPGTPVARRPGSPDASPQGSPRGSGQNPAAMAPHGFPVGRPDTDTPPHGFPARPGPGPGTPISGRQELGTPVAWGPGAPAGPPPHGTTSGGRPPGSGGPVQPAPWQPDASNGGFAGSPGLGTDLFAIASQGGQAGYPARGEQKAPSQKNPIGILVLMGVAAISLVVIMILVVAAFT